MAFFFLCRFLRSGFWILNKNYQIVGYPDQRLSFITRPALSVNKSPGRQNIIGLLFTDKHEKHPLSAHPLIMDGT